MRQPTSVLIYVVCCSNDQISYLLLHRNPRPDLDLKAFWQGITGGLEENETILQAAKRELSEETGIITEKLIQNEYEATFKIKEEWMKYYPKGSTVIREYTFIYKVDDYIIPKLSNEHDQYKWVKIDEAISLLNYQSNIEALKSCDTYLSKSI